MIGVGERRLDLEHIAEKSFALCVSIAHDAQRLLARCLQRLCHFQFLSCLERPPMLVGNVNPNLGVGLLQVEPRLLFGVAPRVDLLSLSSPVEDIPRRLNSEAGEVVGKHAAEMGGLEGAQRQTDVRNALGALDAPLELRLPYLEP